MDRCYDVTCCAALVWSALTIVGVALFILSARARAVCAP